MEITKADCPELIGMKMEMEGDRAVYKFGDGDLCHFHVPSDKKLWDAQFMVVCAGGRYFLRDVGVFHPTRIKLDGYHEY